MSVLLFAVTTILVTDIYVQSMRTQEDALRASNAALIARETADRIASQGTAYQPSPTPEPITRGGVTFSRRVTVEGNKATIAITWSRADKESTAEFTTLLNPRSARS